MAKKRLDVALVDRGLAESRTRAQSLVMARRVRVNGEYVTKPGASVSDDDALEVVELDHPYVSRGGLKLAHAIENFGVSVEGKVCADIGASTGGFTDVLLRNGAAKVFAVDVGYGQLDARLRNDPRVVVRERVNARYLTTEEIGEPVGLVSIDVSFISLRMILPPVSAILAHGGDLIALVKPQFEVGREGVGKGGIVRDDRLREEALAGVVAFAGENGFKVVGTTESPIRGAEGNLEYLMHARRAL